ncbi:MAG: hypothetical protein ACRCUY_09470 [Thermoguttaceae bacterium]
MKLHFRIPSGFGDEFRCQTKPANLRWRLAKYTAEQNRRLTPAAR